MVQLLLLLAVGGIAGHGGGSSAADAPIVRTVAASEAPGGYKGIAWGTPCDAARDALQRSGVKFRYAVPERVTDEMRFDPAYAFAAKCSNRSEHYSAFTKLDGDGPDYLDVTVLCRDGKFVAIWMSGLSAYSGALRDVRGKPVKTVTGKDSLGNKAKAERLTDRGDSVRFLQESWNPVDEHYVTYLVMSKPTHEHLVTTQRDCASFDATVNKARVPPGPRRNSLVE